MLKADTNYSEWVDFSNELDAHIVESDTFFDVNLLAIFDKYLGYKYSSITMYEMNSTLKNVVNYNLAQYYAVYNDNLKTHDPLANYISNHFDYLVSSDTKVVKSSEVVPNYMNSDYYHTLNSITQLSYTAVIPFDGYRISVLKSKEQGDFSRDEIRLLNNVGRLLQSKLILHSKIIKPPARYTFEKLKELYFDTIDTGVVILGEDYSVVDHNKIAVELFESLAPELSISEYFANLIPLLNINFKKSAPLPAEKFIKLDKFVIKIRLFSEETTADESSIYYFITVTNAENSADSVRKLSTQTPQAFADKYKLSPRELEIVVAISNGQRYQDIADSLFISIHTVRSHIQNIYRKLEIDNQRTLLYMYNQFINETI